MIATEFVFRTMQLANMLAGLISVCIGILIAYDAWRAERRLYPALMTLRTARFAWLMMLVGAVPILAFYPRLSQLSIMWLEISHDMASRAGALGAMFAMFFALGLATGIGSGKPRRIAVVWLVLLAGAFAATALQNVG